VVTYDPRQRVYEAQLETHNFKLGQLNAVKSRNLAIAGVVNLVANGRGTLDDPQLTASLEIPQLQAEGKTIDHIALQVNVAQHVADISLDTRAVNANIHGRGTVQLTGDYLADAVLDTQSIPLQPLLATYAPDLAAHISGQTELHATLKGPLKHRDRVEAHVVIPELDIHYDHSIDLAAAGAIHADYKNGVLDVARSGLKGTGTDLEFQGSIPILDRSKPVALLLLGSLDLRLAQLFDPDVTSSGQLHFNINSYGARSDPNVRGEVQIVNANFAVADMPLGLSNGNGTLALTGDRLNITNFEGTIGGGKVTARGGVAYHPSLQFDLALSGQGIRMLYPDGVREGLSANLTLSGTPEQATLRGQVNVDQLSFAPDFDLTSLTSFGNEVEEPPSRGFANNLQLNVALRSTQSVNLVSRTMSASGSANLRATGTAAQPVLLGRINLTGGDLIFQGNRYVLQGGVIDFVNPTRTEPNVNASVTTTILQYNIGLRFEGQLDRLRTSYSSTPALPPADIINLIAFGKTQEAANATATPTNQTAEQSIASAVSGQVTSRVQKFAGISQLSVDPTLGNSQQNAGATITVQQRVTSKIFVTFSTDVTSTTRQVIQLEYQATPKVSLSGTRDQNGGFGFDTRITRDW
jgi:translocation and assembly module TamB